MEVTMRFSIGMRTIRREGENYLDGTVANLSRARVLSSPHLAGLTVVDGGSPDPTRHLSFAAGAGLDVTSPDRRVTPNENATRAHEIAAHRDADYYVFMEDDLDFCADFLGSAARWLTYHDDGRHPLFVLGHVRGRRGRATSQPYPVRSFYGSQCYAVPARAHDRLVEWLAAHPVYDNGIRQVTRCHDLRLHQWAASVECEEFLATQPSFVAHVGERSGMGCPPVRFGSWPGREWSYQGERERVA